MLSIKQKKKKGKDFNKEEIRSKPFFFFLSLTLFSLTCQTYISLVLATFLRSTSTHCHQNQLLSE